MMPSTKFDKMKESYSYALSTKKKKNWEIEQKELEEGDDEIFKIGNRSGSMIEYQNKNYLDRSPEFR